MKLKDKTIIKMLVSLLIVLIFVGMFSTRVYATYKEDYRYWDQWDTSYDFQKWGCLIVAEAKLLYAAGIDTSSEFNPDKWYDWKNLNGWGNGYPKALESYASEKGKSLIYKGNCNSESEVWNNINAGYYTILKLNDHWAFVDNEMSKANGVIYIDQSGDTIDRNGPQLLSTFGYKIETGGFYFEVPLTLTADIKPNGYAKLSWNAIEGATKYVIARKRWKVLGNNRKSL